MRDLVQIVYVSRSTFAPMPPERGIEPSVARILAQSRINNARRGLVGALYFGDGCFFQCLEGPVAAVDGLCAALLRDPRHTDLRVLSRRAIEHTSFSAWSMKYVPLDAPMQSLLRQSGLARFDPYRFDEATVARVLDMLRNAGGLADPVQPAASRWTGRRAAWAAGLLAVALVAVAAAWMRRA
ncbi:BLUF domain-containing protein [Frateuria sp. MAH-13]|uniref:BLUF domain-containing protein n=1 Tax=Frateuria flava TaxID=2821489 RepID=A0ABS4DNA6_9GAMM|nr:BLUF domain-containing protein [Frateuria flava]MBP1474511.1 BLUF domain-containing protein [Frateuria flava]